jgi:hypothetical protein
MRDATCRGTMVCDKLPFSAGNSRERAFVQRQATLKGTQTWTASGETATLACCGIIKWPLRALLPR